MLGTVLLTKALRSRRTPEFNDICASKNHGYVAHSNGAMMQGHLVNPTALSKHLGVSRQYVEKLARDGVIERRPEGFDQDQARLQYLAWLRDPHRRSARAEADAELRRLKTLALQLKIEQEQGQLVEHSAMTEIIDEICGLVRSELAGLPARLTRDLQERRRIERAVDEILRRMSERAEEKARLADD
jgi:phage terminase Nu1 subunit (DNA packaging protein)